jgi:hemerythrin superfamily protein
MSDGFALLAQDHEQVQELFDRYATSRDEQVVHDICDALTLHARVEEEAFYPQLRRLVDGGDDLADEAEQEHSALKVLIERVHLAPPDKLDGVVKEMRELVERHAAHEEGTLFPEMRQCRVDAQDLGGRIEVARESALARLSRG